MQSNPRISVNLLVILVRILVNLLVKLTNTSKFATSLLSWLYFPPRGGSHGPRPQLAVEELQGDTYL